MIEDYMIYSAGAIVTPCTDVRFLLLHSSINADRCFVSALVPRAPGRAGCSRSPQVRPSAPYHTSRGTDSAIAERDAFNLIHHEHVIKVDFVVRKDEALKWRGSRPPSNSPRQAGVSERRLT